MTQRATARVSGGRANRAGSKRNWLLVRHPDGTYEISAGPRPGAYVVRGFATYAAAEKAWSRLMKTGRAGKQRANGGPYTILKHAGGQGGFKAVKKSATADQVRAYLQRHKNQLGQMTVWRSGAETYPGLDASSWLAYNESLRGNPGKGTGRFARCVRGVESSGSAVDARAVCAAQEIRMFGKRALQRAAAAGRKRARRANGYPGTRRNPIDAAKAVYEKFHGRPADKIITVKRKVHYHSVTSGIGELVKLKIETDTGRRVILQKFEKSNGAPAILTQNEARTQLFIDGGDQRVDLKPFGITAPYHETEVLGRVRSVEYFTTKDHLRPEDGGEAVYHHKFGGMREVDGKRKRSPLPTLVYDTVNHLLSFAGGGYTLPDEGIAN